MIPLTQNQIADRIYEAYERRREDEPPRDYLGGSAIGRKCERQLWYGFRNAKEVDFPGRLLRLFQTGHREEDRMIDDLRAAGMEVHAKNPSTGDQFEVNAFGDHFSGHFDGLVRGVPDAPKQWHLLETKTSNTKGFRPFVMHKCEGCNRFVDPTEPGICPRCSSSDVHRPRGVREQKPVHYAQMQVYLGLAPKFWDEWGIDGDPPRAALYMVHCKEDDRLYLERVHFDEDRFLELGAKARRIITADEPPDRISFEPDYYLCRWCDYSEICHGAEIPQMDCRTCIHSTPQIDQGGWHCRRLDAPLGVNGFYGGCPKHLYLPPLLKRSLGEVVDYDQSGSQEEIDWIEYDKDGARLRNSVFPQSKKDGGITSWEMDGRISSDEQEAA